MSVVKKPEDPHGKAEKKMISVKAGGKEAVMYIGPTVPGVVASGTVFNNGYPKKLKDAMETERTLAMLMIPVSGLTEARKELRKSGSVLSICYEKVKEER